jgi:hypothetical protein
MTPPTSLHPSVNMCPKCKEKLESYGQPAYTLMDTLSYFWLERIPVYVDMDDESVWSEMGPVIAYLESKGYIISSETAHAELVLRAMCRIEASCICWCKK